MAKKPHPAALPNYDKAEIPRSKLEDYALNPAHEDGRHKARVFKSALGYEQTDWGKLAQDILSALPYQAAGPEATGPWGRKYTVVLPITGPNGNTVNVETAWIIRPGTDYPSLVTTLVPKDKR